MNELNSKMTEASLSSRRNLIVASAGLAMGAALTLAPALADSAPKAAASDLEILNFALSLERLEAAYYAQVIGAHQTRAYLTSELLPLAQELASEEASHVKALEDTITTYGGTPVAAGNYKFPTNAFVSPVGFAWFGYTLEEIGIGAYLGALGKLKSDALRNTAASIYGAEARHAAILRVSSGFNFSPRYFESAYTVDQIKNLIAPYVG